MSPQRGAALLLVFMMLFLFAAGLTLARLPADPQQRQRAETLQQLHEAKEALLAYAVTYEDNYLNAGTSHYPPPGYLPCPNLDLPETDESPDPPCHTHAPILGRFPRRFPAGPGNVYESFNNGTRTGEEFWYALSKGFQNNSPPAALNAASPALLSVDGHHAVVAVLFAPGGPLAGQGRASLNPRDYLEGENADGDNDFTTAGDSNDLLLFITRTEFATRLTERVAADLKRVLDRSFDHDGLYPAVLPADVPPWFAANWGTTTTYVSSGASATLQFGGCLITYTLRRSAPSPMKSRVSCG